MLVMLANKHTRNVFLLSTPSDHAARGVLAQDALARTPLWSAMMKPYPSVNGHRDPKQANRNNSGRLALSPQVLICPPPLLGHFTPLPERSDYPADEGWQWQEDIQAWADRHHVLSPMGFKHQKQNPPNPPQKTLPFLVCLARKPRGTQWSEELLCEPSQTEEPPIPGPSPSSQPPEEVPTHELEPEVVPTESTEEPFGKSPLLFLHSYQPFLSLSCHYPLDHCH
ncbi:hypothetical protein O181_045199 [Austropuccinia psidii MF-1]|uniref:Uncharacterized protein n=1 Tax=Austropuccinia psidii MF-1 TaxID=1389203 RepID=A0A9Q3DLR0_9BASI|nr:hypothetical protein [Austropuccinia psidii MF-1]